MIELHDLSVTFNRGTNLEKRALDHLSLNISEGEFLTVIGSNGAGKSTLLNVITGDIRPRQGSILINGRDVTTWSTERRAKLVSRVFQDPLVGTCGTLTIEENLALALARGQSRGLKRALDPKKRLLFEEAVATLNLGLETRLKKPIGLLSGGQRQAVSLMMAVLAPMDILVLDEHTAALDPKTAAFIIRLTRQIVEEKKLTVLLVTHSMHQALEVGDRTLMLSEGKIVRDLDAAHRKTLTSADLLKLFEEIDA